MQRTSVQINNKVNERQEKGGFNMFKNLKKHIKNEKGFTLIELLAVIVILAIVAAIAVPAIGNIINNSDDKAMLSEASNVLAGAKIARTDGACKSTGETNDLECTKAELSGYVEGIATDITYKADYNSTTNTWTVTHSGLKKFKSKKFTEYFGENGAGKGQITTDGAITEVNLNTALQQ